MAYVFPFKSVDQVPQKLFDFSMTDGKRIIGAELNPSVIVIIPHDVFTIDQEDG